MNIVQQKKALNEIFDSIATTLSLFDQEYSHYWKTNTFIFKSINNPNFSNYIRFDFENNFILVQSWTKSYDKDQIRQMYAKVNAMPKVIDRIYGTLYVYHYFKISKANIDRLRRIVSILYQI